MVIAVLDRSHLRSNKVFSPSIPPHGDLLGAYVVMLKLEFLPKVVTLCMTKAACLLVNQCSGT